MLVFPDLSVAFGDLGKKSFSRLAAPNNPPEFLEDKE